MTTSYRQAIQEAVLREIERLGTQTAVAKKCLLNLAYINQIVTGNYSTIRDEHWGKVARALDVRFEGWQTVETNNSRKIINVLEDAKQMGLFMAISNPAGSGKTATCREYRDTNPRRSVFYYCVEHASTSKPEFLQRLAASLGLGVKKGDYANANGLADIIVSFFVSRLAERPLLIVDEADKLQDSALCFFISLYNAVDGKMGCVVMGTENLEKKMLYGVSRKRNGFDELHSRFGRSFIKLPGYLLSECRAVCAANGLADKSVQSELFEKCGPVGETINGQYVKVLKDLRPLRRKIEGHLLAQEATTAKPLLPEATEEDYMPLVAQPGLKLVHSGLRQAPPNKAEKIRETAQKLDEMGAYITVGYPEKPYAP